MEVFYSLSVNSVQLNKNEKKVFHGICAYPTITDSELSARLHMKLSTLTSIKRRLSIQGYYRDIMFPYLNRLGCELLAIMYMHFNPVIPLKQRMETTKRTIEVFDEIFFSVGELEKGFSLSLSQNYTNIGRINDIRTETFGKLGLLERDYPHEIIFPFETSHIHKFFDFSTFLEHLFDLQQTKKTKSKTDLFAQTATIELTGKEKKVYSALVAHPTATTQQIGSMVHLSRHTVARMKKQFFDQGLLQRLILPNLKAIGVEILTLYHIRFNPSKSPSLRDLAFLNSPSTIFFASRKFEAVLLSAYPTYQTYKEDEMNKIKYLKENNLFSHPPFISAYMLEQMEVIKDFDFRPLVNKILGWK
jgi:hypothetical protein